MAQLKPAMGFNLTVCTMPVQVALVGVLVSKVMTDAEVTFHVYDGTGTIACKAFLDEAEVVSSQQHMALVPYCAMSLLCT